MAVAPHAAQALGSDHDFAQRNSCSDPNPGTPPPAPPTKAKRPSNAPTSPHRSPSQPKRSPA